MNNKTLLNTFLLFSLSLSSPSWAASYLIKDLVGYRDISLTGDGGVVGIPVSIRTDRMISGVKLHLSFNYSPALIPEYSHIKIQVNDEPVGVIPIPKGGSGTVTQDIVLDPRLFVDYNSIKLQLVGHYTTHCEDPTHSSLWVSISNDSRLDIDETPIKLSNELANLPLPFFDIKDNGPVAFNMAFGRLASWPEWRSAGIIASWFGAMADYRKTSFNVYQDELPSSHTVVIALPGSLPKFLRWSHPLTGPTLALMDLPGSTTGKILLVTGRTPEELNIAARALVGGRSAWSRDVTVISNFKPLAARKPYDAPRWLSPDGPVAFKDLITDPAQLQAQGIGAKEIKVSVQLPPDLFIWHNRGLPVDLKFRYTPPAKQDNSALNFSVNNQFTQSFNLSADATTGGTWKALLPFFGKKKNHDGGEVDVPSFQLGSKNALSFQFNTNYALGECAGRPGSFRAAIDPTSTLDISGFYHHAKLPDLKRFAASGYPYTRLADLADTAFVLPDAPQTDDLKAAFVLLAKLGAATGYPGTNVRMLPAHDIETVSDRNLVLVGNSNRLPLVRSWYGKAAVLDDNLAGEMKLQPVALPVAGNIRPSTAGAMAMLVGFESPLKSGKSVVAATWKDGKEYAEFLALLANPSDAQRFAGDTTILSAKGLVSYRTQPTYTVGDLPWWLPVRIWFSDHPLALALLTLLAVMVFGAWLSRKLRSVAEKRLGNT